MSQGQPARPSPYGQTEPIKYGDVFDVSGELADQPVAPRDAAMMQSAENQVLGQTPVGGAASVMQSAASQNEAARLVSHNQLSTAATGEGVNVRVTDTPGGRRVVTESVGGQVVEQLSTPQPVAPRPTTAGVSDTPATAAAAPAVTTAYTIGDALEATAATAGDKPVSRSDASAIQAAEFRATGSNVPGGVGAQAMSAADANEKTLFTEKTKLGEVLADAKGKLAGDKVATAQDAEKVTSAELRNNPSVATHPAGVAENVAAAARLNQQAY